MNVPTRDQEAALHALAAFLKSETNHFLLAGSAGTGKTFTVATLVAALPDMSRIALCAPTHKAARVLSTSLAQTIKSFKETSESLVVQNHKFVPDIEILVTTIHSLLKLRMETHDGELVLRLPDMTEAAWITEVLGHTHNKYALIIVDEASMVSSFLWDVVAKVSQYAPRLKWLWIGDPAQLPPVHEVRSRTFDVPVVQTLTTIVRQARNNPIIGLATAIRGRIEGAPRIDITQFSDSGTGVFLREDGWEPALRRAFTASNSYEDPDSVRVICWTNAAVVGYNDVIRTLRSGHTVKKPWLPGERFVTASPIYDVDSGDGQRRPMTILFPQDTEGHVVEVNLGYHPSWDIDLPVWIIDATIDNALGEPTSVRIYVPTQQGSTVMHTHLATLARHARSEISEHQDRCKRVERCKGVEREAFLKEIRAYKNPWANFWKLKNSISDIRHLMSITAHRSQGSTFKNVFVDVHDILKNRNKEEALRCLYVAVTRASHNVVLNCRYI